MTTWKVFLSYTTNDPDITRAVTIIRAAIESRPNLQLLEGTTPRVGYVPDEIMNLIDECQVFFAVMSRYALATIPGEGREERHLPPPWVVSEASYAIGCQKRFGPKTLGAFVEQGLDIKGDTGIFGVLEPWAAYFRRDRLGKKFRQDVDSYLDSLIQKLEQRDERDYLQTELRKQVTVLSNGNSIIVSRSTVQVMREGVRELRHTLAPGPHPGKVKLPSLAELSSTDLAQRHRAASFGARLVSLNSEVEPKDFSINVKEEFSRQDEIAFFVQFEGHELKRGDIVIYEYTWSLPKMFAAKRGELRSKEFNAIHIVGAHGPVETAVLELIYQRPIEFAKLPYVEHGNHVSTKGEGSFEPSVRPPSLHRDDFHEIVYAWEFRQLQETWRVVWIPS